MHLYSGAGDCSWPEILVSPPGGNVSTAFSEEQLVNPCQINCRFCVTSVEIRAWTHNCCIFPVPRPSVSCPLATMSSIPQDQWPARTNTCWQEDSFLFAGRFLGWVSLNSSHTCYHDHRSSQYLIYDINVLDDRNFLIFSAILCRINIEQALDLRCIGSIYRFLLSSLNLPYLGVACWFNWLISLLQAPVSHMATDDVLATPFPIWPPACGLGQ